MLATGTDSLILDSQISCLMESREHNMVRFSNGVPQVLWYSQHASGEAFTYGATEKQGQRPIAYSGKGTHAVYAVPGYVEPTH
jgi:hypothetical protein